MEYRIKEPTSACSKYKITEEVIDNHLDQLCNSFDCPDGGCPRCCISGIDNLIKWRQQEKGE